MPPTSAPPALPSPTYCRTAGRQNPAEMLEDMHNRRRNAHLQCVLVGDDASYARLSVLPTFGKLLVVGTCQASTHGLPIRLQNCCTKSRIRVGKPGEPPRRMTSSRVALVLAFFTVVQGSGDVLQTSLRPSITPSIKPSAQTGTDSTTHETVGRRLGATASPSASVPPTATSVPTTIPTVTIAPTSCCDSNDGATDAKGNSCLAYEYKVYACQTQDSFNFSASEMCCACGGGSGVVTGCAAEVTTKGPSVAPTVLPRLTVVPPTLELQVVKPFEVEGVFYLVNLNRHTLSWSSNILKTRLNSSNIVISTASTMSLGDGENAELNVKFLSSDVLPGKYTTELEIETHAENMSMITTEYMNVTLMVTAVAAESQSRCIISTRPTLGSLWDGIAIKTYDSDANRLTDDTNEDLRVSLKRLSNNYSVVICSVSWDDDRYVAKCDVPQSDQAGNWTVEVELNDQMICEEDVGMDCPKHEYETGEGTCKICMEGAGKQVFAHAWSHRWMEDPHTSPRAPVPSQTVV